MQITRGIALYPIEAAQPGCCGYWLSIRNLLHSVPQMGLEERPVSLTIPFKMGYPLFRCPARTKMSSRLVLSFISHVKGIKLHLSGSKIYVSWGTPLSDTPFMRQQFEGRLEMLQVRLNDDI